MTRAFDRKSRIADLSEDFHALQMRLIKSVQAPSSELQLTQSQLVILHIVEGHDGISIKELAGLMGVTSSAATQQVDRLVRKGFLVREASANDRRVQKIGLSMEAARRRNRVKSRIIGQLVSVFDALTDEEFATYCALFKKLANRNLEEVDG